MEPLMTLVLCLANCGGGMSREDELGILAGSYAQLCSEMYYLKQNHCPELQAPVMLQCLAEVDRALSVKRSNDFKAGMKFLQQRFAQELPAVVNQKYTIALPRNENDTTKTCFWLAQDNAEQRFQKLKTIQTLEKKREP
jgi:hypothetical protein